MILSISLFSQDRIDREKITFDSTSSILSKSIGWAYNSVFGEWVSYDNVISDNKDYKGKYKSLQGSWMMSQTEQNFQQIQTKTILYDSKKYYVIIVEKWSGEYQYPSIKEDWYVFKKTIGYIYTEDEYKKLQNIDSLVEIKTQHIVSMGSKYEKYDEVKFLDLIQVSLSTIKGKYSPTYIFPVMMISGKVRFYVPEYFHTYSRYDFTKKYFETDISSFSKIIIK